ncbi:MAG: chemotaxis protein CheW [Roseinatronobacter sp.]
MSVSVDIATFNTDGALYAVPVSRVQEILDLRPFAAMPNAPAHLLGIIDLRGANIPVVDLRPLAEAELLRWSGSAIAGIGRRKG